MNVFPRKTKAVKRPVKAGFYPPTEKLSTALENN
jgi:hypothetical protein